MPQFWPYQWTGLGNYTLCNIHTFESILIENHEFTLMLPIPTQYHRVFLFLSLSIFVHPFWLWEAQLPVFETPLGSQSVDPLTPALLGADSDTSPGLLAPGLLSHSVLSDGVWMKKGIREEGRVGGRETGKGERRGKASKCFLKKGERRVGIRRAIGVLELGFYTQSEQNLGLWETVLIYFILSIRMGRTKVSR